MYNLLVGLRLRIWMPLVAVLIVLLSIALIFVYGVPVVGARLTDYAESRTFSQAAAVAESVPDATGVELGERLDLYARTTDGEILVVDSGGRLVARAGSAPGFEASQELLRKAAAGKRMSEKRERLNVAVAPVVGSGGLAGGVVFASGSSEVTAYQLFLRSGLEAAGVASILGGGLMLLLGTLLSRRVERLTLGARSIEGGDLSYRMQPGFKDEIGELAETFNTMAARLQDSFANLENRVAERTAELEAERARLEAVLQQMPSGVIIAEAPSGRLVLGNEQVERIWRHPFRPAASIDEYQQYRTIRRNGRPHSPEERPLARSIRTGEVVKEEEIDFLRGDGTAGTMQVSSAPIRDTDGHIVAAVAIFNDVTEQKRAEEAQREIEERYRVVVQTASDAIVMIDEESRIEFVNRAAEKVFGYAQAEMLGESLTMLMPEPLREAHLASLKRYTETGKRNLDWESIELPGLRKGGEQLPLEVSFGEFSKDGRSYFTGFIRDISERKRAEENIRRLNEELEQRVEERTSQLEQERATLDAILNNLTEGVLAADGRDRIVFANPAARSMLALDGQGRLGELPNPWEDFDLAEAISHCAEEGGGCIEARVQGRGGLLQVKLEHLPEFGDHRGGTLVVVRDLSESRRLEARQQRFLANAAHELKTPITTILGAADLLLTEEEDDPEIRQRFLNHIFAEAQRMQRLSETLLRLARVGWDLREPEIRVVDLDATVREVLWRMAPLAESAGVELSSSGEGRRVRADGQWLEQALMVIVSNAIKYSGRGGRVVLRLGPGFVAAEDDGDGIAEADLPHVFDRFYQGQDSSGGFGLGLPICKELVERMGGAISIASQKGTGTTVSIELPEVERG
ncbi:MAG TPA: PAS domain S-box protein [Rubrobacter sp.]|nr:PAS domain S-box protein [Rubrobacter sp.]